MGFVNRKLSQAFHKLGNTIARYPKYFIIASVILSMTLGTGILKIQFYDDIEVLYIHNNAESKSEKLLVQSVFPSNETSKFTPSRKIGGGRFAR